MSKLQILRGFASTGLSQGVKLHPFLAEGWLSVYSSKSTRTVPVASLVLSYGLLFLLIAIAAGCTLDPNARKLKYLQQGDLYSKKGKYPEANISYSRALQIDPRFVEAHYKRAQCLLKQGSWAAAFQELSRTVELQPENWPAQLDLGQLLLAGGKPQEAKDRALLILHSGPKHSDAEILLSDADVALGNLKEALEEAKKAAEIAPDRSSGLVNLGLMQAKAGALGDAEASLKKAQSLDPLSVTPLITLANLYQRARRWADAEKEYQAAISLAPKSTMPRIALAGLYLAQGQESLAEKVLTDAKQQLSDDPAAYRLLGDYYLSHGENAKAVAEFGALSAVHQNDLTVRKTYIQLLILNKRITESSQLNDALLDKTPQDAEALILKGQIQLQQKKVDESIQSLQRALKYAPGNAMGHYQLGAAFQQKGSTQQAQSEWREAVRLRPNLSEAWRAMGVNALQRGDWRELESIADQLKTIAPRSADGYLYHATARMNQSDASAAEADLNQLLLIAPNSALGYVKLGQLRAAERRLDDAGKMYRQGLARDPHSLEALEGLVDLDLLSKKPAQALRLIQDQLDSNPANAALYLLQGKALLQNKQLEEAEHSMERAVEIDGQNVSALVQLAAVESSLGKFGQSSANYQRAIGVTPNDVRLYVALGSVHESQGDWQQAQTLYQKALAIQPENALAANNLAFIMVEHGESVNVALTLAQTARRGLPNLPNSADTLGWAYYHNGAYSVAAPLFEDAVTKVPENLTYHYHLGLTYQKLNDLARARTEFEKTINLDPKSALANEARRALSQSTGT
jgi:tetratricopeptide (TPR) repeat protein